MHCGIHKTTPEQKKKKENNLFLKTLKIFSRFVTIYHMANE